MQLEVQQEGTANMKRIEELAQPVIKVPVETKDPFAVQPSAMTYVTSRRTKELAALPPRYETVMRPREGWKVSWAAKHAKGTRKKEKSFI